MKKLLAILAILVTMIAIFTVSASAETYSGTCGENVTWKLDTEIGLLTISGTGAMADYISSSSAPWYPYRSSIETVVIENGVTSIGDYAFYGCSVLTSITIPNSITSIGKLAFFGCSVHRFTEVHISDISAWYNISFSTVNSNPLYYAKKLYLNGTLVTNLVIPDSVTSINDYAFYNCAELTSISIPDSVTSIGNATFRSCSGLESITVDSNNSVYYSSENCLIIKSSKKLILGCKTSVIPNDVKSIDSGAFSGCSGLTSITIPNSVTHIDSSAFSGCSGLTSITIPDSVTSIGTKAFMNCSGLESIIFKSATTTIYDSADTLPVTATIYGEPGSTAIAYAVKYTRDFVCSGTCGENVIWTLDSGILTISGTGVMKNYDDYYLSAPWYSYRSSIETVVIENGVTSIGGGAFSDCSKLTSITIPDSVTSIGERAFYNCTELEKIIIGKGIKNIGFDAFSYCSKLNGVYIRDMAAWCNISFKDYSSNPLYYAKKLYLNGTLVTDLVIPDSVTSINDYAFYNCAELTSVTISDSVTSIGGYAFYNCYRLTSIKIPNSVTVIGGYAFYNCYKLTNVTIPNSIKTIGSYAFYKCTALTLITIPNSVTSVGSRAFEGCTRLALVNIGNGVTSIGERAFYNCTELEKIIIGKGIKNIGFDAFSYCSKLNGVYIRDMAAWCNISFKDYSSNPLYYAEKLYLNNILVTDLIIPDGTTTISANAFYNCTELTSVTIPNSVTSIGKYAFKDCKNLTKIYYNATECADFASKNGVFTNVGRSGTGISVVIGANVKKLPNCLFYSTDNTSFVPKIISVEFEENSVCESIGSYAFHGCCDITSIDIPNSVKQIGLNAFGNCTALTSMTIPFAGATKDGTENTHFGYIFGAPDYAYNSIYVPAFLTTLTIDGDANIQDCAFYDCTGLVDIIISSPKTTLYDSADTLPDSATIHGHALSTAKNYANAYARQFIPICEYENIAGVAHLCTPATDTSPATYYESCPVCGVNGTETFISRLDSFSINLGKDISINYNIIPAAEDADKEIYLKFHMNGNEYILTDYTEKNSQLTFSFHITPQCIGETINAEIYIGGIKYQFVEDCGVLSYCERLLALSHTDLGITETKYTKLKTLIGDLLAYGAAAQDFVDYKTDSKPSISSVAPSEFIPLTSTDTSLSASTVGGLAFDSATLRFHDVNNLVFNFKASDTTGVTVRINGVDTAYTCTDEENSIYTAISADIYAKNFGEVYTVELLKDGEVAQTLTYSIKSYVYSKQSKTDEQGEPTPMAILAQRTWNYGLSAKAYNEK